MKTYCKLKDTDVRNPEQIYIAVYDCVKPKLYRNDFCDLLIDKGGISKKEIIEENKEKST